MAKIKQITQDMYPCKKLIFKYKTEKHRRRLVLSSKLMMMKAAKKAKPELYRLPIDCGREGELQGRMVPIDTLGKFVFGMKRFKSCILTVPHEDRFDIWLYSDEWCVVDLVVAAAWEVGLVYDKIETL